MAITKIEVPELFDFGSDNSAFKLPTGTTVERPTSPSNGEMRFNTTTGYVEYYDTTDAQWWEIDYAPDPLVPSDNFNNLIYTGDGTTGRVITTGLAADLVIIKNRSTAQQDWIWFDIIRGPSEYIRSNRGNSPQYYAGSGQGVSAFGSTTVTIGDNAAGNLGANGSVGGTYSGAALQVMYSFKGGGAAVSNTDGTITSQVSANTAAGFSIISYTGASGTVGSGLNAIPEIIIQKKTSANEDWYVYFPPGVVDSNYNYLVLNSTAASGTTGSTPPTTTTFNPVSSSGNYIAYAFHSVAGYSKIGTYTGNGVSGNAIATGFEPAFVMIKAFSVSGAWYVFDNKRTTGVYSNQLMMNSINAETTNTYVELTSTGFTLNTTASDLNNNGATFIYMAFAI